MIKKLSLLMLLMALFMPWAANAQNPAIVEIGTGTSTNYYPIPGFWGYQYDVYLYTPSASIELNESDCIISSIAYDLSSINTNSGAKMEIWLKDVAADYALVASTTFATYINGATKVVDDDEFTTSETGWKTIPFTESTFEHEAGKTLLVAVRGLGCTTSGGCSRYCRYTSTSGTHWYKRADTNDPGQDVSGSTDGNRSNIRVNITPIQSTCPKPTLNPAEYIEEEQASISWTENGTATRWVLQYSTSSDFSNATSVNRNGIPAMVISDLSPATTYYVHVKANCGDGDESRWSNVISFTTEHITVTANQIVNTVSSPATEMTWDEFATYVNNGDHFTHTEFFLMEDITVTTMVGTSKTICFQGTFDGQGHTITLSGGDFGTSSSPQSNGNCAPFRFVSGATFMNLEVTGDIYSSSQKAAGFIATAGHGDLTFTNCVSSVNIHASRSNDDGTHGGFIGLLQGYNQQHMTATFNGCAFTGSITTTNGTSNVGGFVGWCEWRNDSSVEKGYCHLVLNNCLVNPNATCISSGSKTFSRFRNQANSLGTDDANMHNCYYTQSIGDPQGKQTYSISAVSPVTVAMNGTPTQYSMSGIDAYAPGIVYNSTLYAGEGDNVSLILDGSTDGYQASYGNLTGTENPFTLAMVAHSTEISDLTTPIGLPTKIVASNPASDEMTWEQFVSYVNNDGETYQLKTVRLMEDITVTTMVGTSSRPFQGTFDGQGHTLTVDISSDAQGAAPFNYIQGATIENLVVTGTVTATAHHAGGLVGFAEYTGTSYNNAPASVYDTIRNCLVHTNVTNTSGNNYIGGIIGHNKCARTTIIGCVYDGTLTSSGYKGGMIGWSDRSALTVIDSYFCGDYSTSSNFSPIGCKTKTQNSSNVTLVLAFSNFYYNKDAGTFSDGAYNALYNASPTGTAKHAYTISAGTDVSVAPSGDATVYSCSGITAYAQGIVYNDGTTTAHIAGDGDQVALNLSYTGSDSFAAYATTSGTLNGSAITGNDDPYTLTMANGDAIISVLSGDIIHQIYTKADWESFCSFVNSGYSYEGETVTLEADIIDDPVTTTCGLQANLFKGTFDGQGHTLTVNIASSGNTGNAPFKYISGATIKNLIVEGTVNAASGDGNRHAGGLVGYAWSGTNTIQNCLVNTTVNSSSDYAGGIIGHGKTSNIVMTGCAYTGEIKATGTNPVGGLIGWSDNLTGLTITDCLFAGTYTNSDSGKKFHPIGCTGHGDQISADIRTISNTYYTLDHSNLNATTQTLVYNLSNKGKHAYTITGISPVTVAMNGTPTSYDASGIDAYTAGIVYGGNIYAGDGDNVSLTLNGSADGYQASYGTLEGSENPYTLTMAPHDTEIADLTTPLGLPTKIVLNPTAGDEMTWEQFASYVNNGDNYEGKTVTLMEDITITSQANQAGTEGKYFSGTFNGNGRTITVEMTATGNHCAPFYGIKNATINNLVVTGSISSAYQGVGGICGVLKGSSTFTNCVSDVAITSTCSNTPGDSNGWSTCGGFVGSSGGGDNPTFIGCAFTGSLTATRNNCGGFVGFHASHSQWSANTYGGRSTYTNCLFAPSSINISNDQTAVFSCGYNGGQYVRITVTNCYYNEEGAEMNLKQSGKRAYSITGVSPVTVAMNGEPTQYNVSGIDAYNIGIVHDGNIYAGPSENVLLILEGSPSDAYQSDHGTITGVENPFTLHMEAFNTEISALTCPPPTGLAATTTSNSAVLNWNGISDQYNLQLYEPHFFESFEEDLSQWTIYKGGDDASLEWGIENPNDNSADLNAHSGNYAAVSYSDVDVHADNWLVSPQIQFPNQTTLKFWIMRYTYDDTLDEYEVRLSTTGNAIEDFDVVLKEKAAANPAWTEVVIDLSAYDGQQGYIAIRHDYTNGFFLMVDDFGIYGWSEPISVNGNTYTVENLLPNTNYRWQVQADCGDEDGVSFWSEGNFTTLEACPIPTDLNVSEVTANGATIAWTGYSACYEVMVSEGIYMSYDFEDNAISADFTTTTDYPWTVVANNHSGAYCAKSGNNGVSSSTSDMVLEVTLAEECTLSFTAKVSSENSYDKAYFSIDGVDSISAISGAGSWRDYSYTLEAGTHTLRWYYSKDSSVNSNDDCFYVDDIIIQSSNEPTWITYTASESPFILNDATNILPETTYSVKVIGFCEGVATEDSEIITFTTLDENTKIFVIEGDWNEDGNWVPAGVPSIDENVILRAEATVFDVAEANSITIEGTAALIIEDGGQLKTNADVEATMKKFIIGYGTDYVETNNGYYLMTLPTAAPVAAADAGLITEESDFDLYTWDRTATDEEWQNNHDGIDLQNSVGFLYANRDDMEMSFTATLRNSGEPVVVTPAFDEVEHGGWNLCGNPFPCEAYISTDAEGMTFYRLIDNELVPIEGAIAPLEAFFVKATAAGQTFTISREATRE